MLEIYTNQSRMIVDFIRNFFQTPIGIFLYAVTTGVIGVAILLLFLSQMLAPSALILFLPVIIGFNCAAGGYAISDKGKHFPLQKISKVALAVMLSISGCLLITLFCPWEPLLDADRYFTSCVIALGSTFFGSWIATKNKALQKKS